MIARFLIALALLGTAACTPTEWDKPGATKAQFIQDSARCRLMARGMNGGGFSAEGSARFVAVAALGSAIGTAIDRAATVNDCLMADGYTPRSASSPQAQSLNGSTPSEVNGTGGSFAWDRAAGKYGYSFNEASKAAADNAALKSCASDSCKIVFRIPGRQCGALATTDDGKVWGGARRDRSDAAEAAALANCAKRTPRPCHLRVSKCNQ